MAHRLLSLALLLSSTAFAQTPPIRPGLWETTPGQTLVNGKPMPGMGEMAKQMEQMPPELRKQMQAQMQKQGVQFGAGTVRTCISLETLQRNDWMQSNQGRCQTTITERSSGSWRWKASCAEPKGEGEGVTHFDGDRAYKSEMRWTTQQSGKPQLMQSSASARWISADCGGLAPLNPNPAAKNKP
jgi:hypothetical protein